jgi:hypothetical protein
LGVVLCFSAPGSGCGSDEADGGATATATLAARPDPNYREILAQDPRPAVQALSRWVGPMADPRIVSVEETTYRGAFCGRAYFRPEFGDAPMWVVAIEATWFPPSGPPGALLDSTPYRAVRAWVLDRETGTSMQIFSAEALVRDPRANCGP